MGNAKRRKTKENDNYGIYFHLIASKMGFTCSNTTQMLVFRVWCVPRTSCVRSMVDESKWAHRNEEEKAKALQVRSSIVCRWLREPRSCYYWPRKWPRPHRFGHNVCFRSRRPMSGLYKFASTKMDSNFQTFCAVVVVHQFVVDCRLRYCHHRTDKREKQWLAFAFAAGHLIGLS